jgi:hypothetical protein
MFFRNSESSESDANLFSALASAVLLHVLENVNSSAKVLGSVAGNYGTCGVVGICFESAFLQMR